MKDKIIVIAGPTASGKSELAVKISKEINGEVISADSMQIYRGMDIGTAKIKKEEMQGIRHHMIDITDADNNYSAAEYKMNAVKAIKDIISRGKTPVIAGGTGLYIHSLICDVDFSRATGDNGFRESMNEFSNNELHEKLKAVDPDAARRIHKNDKKRIIRRLEILRNEADKDSDYCFRKPNNDFDFIKICITMPRDMLYERINKRVDIMMKEGLLDEVSVLYGKYGSKNTAMQAIGYKELIACIEGKAALEDAVEILKQNSRRFAKRQLTWFKREESFAWFDISEYSDYNAFLLEILTYIKEQMA